MKKALEEEDSQGGGGGCELCSDEPVVDDGHDPLEAAAEAAAGAKKAVHYCVECGQRMCEQCGTMHRRMKATQSHQLVDLAAKAAAAGEAIEKQLRSAMSAPANCQLHPAEQLKVSRTQDTTAYLRL